MRYTLATLVLVFAACVAAPAEAGGVEALAAYEAGQYDEALIEAGKEQTADTHALSARILLAKAMCGNAPPEQEVLDLALAEANAALSLNAVHIEGRLQKAIALSLMARSMTTREARRSGHGETARDLVKSVLEDDPENIYAHGFMSVWNIEVIRKGGRIGGMVMGASLKDARRHYERAVAIDPQDASVHWQYARALAVLDAKKYEDEIRDALEAALTSETETALERTMKGRSSELFEAFSSPDITKVQTTAAQLL